MKFTIITAILMTASICTLAATNNLILHGEPSDSDFNECSVEVYESDVAGTVYEVTFKNASNKSSVKVYTKKHKSEKYDLITDVRYVKVTDNSIENKISSYYSDAVFYKDKFDLKLDLKKDGLQISEVTISNKATFTNPITMIQTQCPGDGAERMACRLGVNLDIAKAFLGIPETTRDESSFTCTNLK